MTTLANAPGHRIVLGVVGNDIHVVALRVLELGLAGRGMRPFNIGVGCMPDDFVAAAIETNAQAVMISSLNGEAEHWCRDIRERFAAAGIPDIILYLGGNPIVGDRDPQTVETLFKGFGFDRVFYRTESFNPVFDLLETDLAAEVAH